MEVFIARLRRKLGAGTIETVRGLGYRVGTAAVSAPSSLRGTLLTGAILWTVGLFVLAGIVATDALFRFPRFPRLFHGMFANVPLAAAVALACLAGGVLQIRRALAALTRLRAGLSLVHAGEHERIAGAFPREVQPLIDDLNALLDHRAQTVRRALSRAGDLAHGLKTPLAVIAREAERDAVGAAAIRAAAPAGGADAPADRLSPGARPGGGGRLHARRVERARRRRGGAGPHADATPRRSGPRHRVGGRRHRRRARPA